MPDPRPVAPGPLSNTPPVPGRQDEDEESSVALIVRARNGDADALERLFARHLVPLRRWTAGRLPRWARDITDTQDLVQDALLETFKRIELFEPRHAHALRTYLRQAVLNRIRSEFRRRQARPARGDLDSQHPDGGPSPLDRAVSGEFMERYEKALGRLAPDDRDAIVARIELGLSYEELAEAQGRPNANAARSTVVRALVRLGAELSRAE